MARSLQSNSTEASDTDNLVLKVNENIIYAAKPSSPPFMENKLCPAVIHASADASELLPEPESEPESGQMKIIG